MKLAEVRLRAKICFLALENLETPWGRISSIRDGYCDGRPLTAKEPRLYQPETEHGHMDLRSLQMLSIGEARLDDSLTRVCGIGSMAKSTEASGALFARLSRPLQIASVVTAPMLVVLSLRPDPSVVTAPIAGQKSLLVMTQQSHGAARWLYALAVCCSRSPRSLLLAARVCRVPQTIQERMFAGTSRCQEGRLLFSMALQPVSEGVASQSFAGADIDTTRARILTRRREFALARVSPSLRPANRSGA